MVFDIPDRAMQISHRLVGLRLGFMEAFEYNTGKCYSCTLSSSSMHHSLDNVPTSYLSPTYSIPLRISHTPKITHQGVVICARNFLPSPEKPPPRKRSPQTTANGLAFRIECPAHSV